MNRDVDVLRRILIAARDSKSAVVALNGIDDAAFAAHAQWLSEAGLVSAALRIRDERPASAAIVFRLTWKGLEVADAMIDEALWRRVCARVLQPGESWTFDVLIDALRRDIRYVSLPDYD